MKRSKLFLGATACLLALAGVAATKVAKFNSISSYYSLTTTTSGSAKVWCKFFQTAGYTITSNAQGVVKIGTAPHRYTLQTVGASGSSNTFTALSSCGSQLYPFAQ